MTEALKIVQLFDEAMAVDVVGSLRRAADTIELETADHDRTVAIIAVQVSESGSVEVFGWGRTDTFHAMGALAAAQIKITPE